MKKEGSVYFHEDDSVIWSDAHNNRLLRWSPTDGNSVIRQPSHYQSGNYHDLEGRLVLLPVLKVNGQLSDENQMVSGKC